ncbi:hypothetical protein LZC95_49800 [Pendulispora brunnea]|uniref:STAS domain-containing protein n=1 Tax=Pendulispora brunnea TaxID=2905690 RepID=A0ABZ2KAY8_9BACT
MDDDTTTSNAPVEEKLLRAIEHRLRDEHLMVLADIKGTIQLLSELHERLQRQGLAAYKVPGLLTRSPGDAISRGISNAMAVSRALESARLVATKGEPK